jgi:Protein of unknown function (DUF1800)
MGNDKPLHRKEFLKSFIGAKTKKNATSNVDTLEAFGDDPLFDKYSRKTLGNRHYSTQIVNPSSNGTTAERIGNVTSGLGPYTGPWTEWEVAHLLRRLHFGVKKTSIDTLKAAGMNASVDAMLTITQPTTPSPQPLNNYQNYTDTADSGNIPYGSTWTNKKLTYATNSNDGNVDYNRFESLIRWQWGLTLDEVANPTIREKMVHFWYHFIPVVYLILQQTEGNAGVSSNDYMQIFRTNALGNFKTIIKAVAKSPAMLVYLGGQYSTATTPNENFGRELFELFMLGKAPTQNYTEDDVQAASKIFSGWKTNDFYGEAPYPFIVAFDPNFHNQENKTFSSFFGNTTINNQPGAAGANEFDQFFDMVFAQQGTTIAKYICRRLYRFFVYYDIDANVEANVIVPLAAFLISSNWEMAPVVNKLFKSAHFYDVVNRGVMIKSPIDFISGSIRTFRIPTAAPSGANYFQKQYEAWGYLQNLGLGQFEQGIGTVPTVSGYKAYYQSPTFYQNWINSNTIQQRSLLLEQLVGGYLNSDYTGDVAFKLDTIVFVQQFENSVIQNPVSLINAIIPLLFSVDLPQSFKEQTKTQNLLANQTSDSYWTDAWNNYFAFPNNMQYKNIVTERLKSLFTSLLQLSEFQLM